MKWEKAFQKREDDFVKEVMEQMKG